MRSPLSPAGILLLDKPAGPTSHDAVEWARRALGVPRTGHCGSLDPRATGLLLITVGQAVKWQDKLMAARKIYRGCLQLGLTTDTDDLAGKPLRPPLDTLPSSVTEEKVRELFRHFTGTFEQRVPLYSAVKVKGRRLYDYARHGEPVDLPTKTVTLHRLELSRYALPFVDFEVECSKGTYVRSLARDVGEKLGVGATLASLRREAVGPFRVSEAWVWDGTPGVPATPLGRAFVSLPQVLDHLRREGLWDDSK